MNTQLSSAQLAKKNLADFFDQPITLSEAERHLMLLEAEQDLMLNEIEQNFQPTAAYQVVVPNFEAAERYDPAKLHLLSRNQIIHAQGAEGSAMGYWRNEIHKCAHEQSDNYDGFETQTKKEKKVQSFENPGVGLGLQCLTSKMSASNKYRQIIQDYIAQKLIPRRAPEPLNSVLQIA